MSGQLCEQPRLIVGAWASASHGRWCGIVDGVRAADTSPAQPSPAQPSPAQHLTRARARKWAGAGRSLGTPEKCIWVSGACAVAVNEFSKNFHNNGHSFCQRIYYLRHYPKQALKRGESTWKWSKLSRSFVDSSSGKCAPSCCTGCSIAVSTIEPGRYSDRNQHTCCCCCCRWSPLNINGQHHSSGTEQLTFWFTCSGTNCFIGTFFNEYSFFRNN